MLATVFTKTTRDRWKGAAVAAISLGLLLGMELAVYQNVDVGVYDSMPEAFRSLMNIPKGADIASLGIGVLYGFYGAMTLAAIALSMGAASIAGEERDGTIGILLSNPKSRTRVLLSKAASMMVLTGLATAVLWGAAHIAASLFGVELGEMRVGAYSIHLFVNAVFYGFMAMAIGAWTGRRRLASGTTAGVMVLAYFAAGILQLIPGWEGAAKASPWYYFDGSDPVINGIGWSHLGLLIAASALLGFIAITGLNRRDLRAMNLGTTLLDRLRESRLTRKIVERLAGSTRVSRIWVKTGSEHQGLLIVTAYVMFLIMGVIMGPVFAVMDNTLLAFADQIPKALYAFFGAAGGSMSTPEGFYQVETFGMMAPIAIMVVTVVVAAGALAGEERDRTMGLLLANPIKRSTVVIEKTATMVIYSFAVGFAMFTGVWAGSAIGGLGMDVGHIAATSLLVTLLGLVFGALALLLGAVTGRVQVATLGAVGAALFFHIFTSLVTLNDNLARFARWSPFHYYLSSDPLNNGMDWGNGAVLTGLTVVLVAVSVVAFNRRDLRQTG